MRKISKKGLKPKGKQKALGKVAECQKAKSNSWYKLAFGLGFI
jgi:hypothetical protein